MVPNSLCEKTKAGMLLRWTLFSACHKTRNTNMVSGCMFLGFLLCLQYTIIQSALAGHLHLSKLPSSSKYNMDRDASVVI